MTKYRSIIISIFILLMFTQCGSEQKKNNRTVIIGNYFPGDSKIYLNEVHAGSVKTLDSADISIEPSFTFILNSPDYALFRLESNDLYPLIVVAKDGDTIRIEQTNDPAWAYNVIGNDECMMVASYLEKLNRDQYKVDSLSLIFHRISPR